MEQAQLTDEQIAQLKEQKIKNFQKMGIPSGAGQMMKIALPTTIQHAPAPVEQSYPEATVDNSHAGNILEQVREQLAMQREQSRSFGPAATQEKLRKLEAIKNGAKRNEFKPFLQAEGVSQEFSPIEVKPRKNPRMQNPNQKPTVDVPVAKFNAPRSSEAEAFESILTGGGSGMSFSSTPSAVNNMDVQIESSMPAYDPVGTIRRKAAENGEFSTSRITKSNNPSEMSEIKMLLEDVLKQKNTGVDMSLLKPMMETIAKETAIKAINEVIEKFASSQKAKKTYEVYNKEHNVVKIEGKLFKLTPVTIKKS